MITADTNIFVYAEDASDSLKQDLAVKVVTALAVRHVPIALQVVGELQNALRRKLKMERWAASEAANFILGAFDCFPSTRAAASLALAQMASGRLSYWDALMLASAREAGCTVMISEDMQDGARLFGIEIVNPFGAQGLSSRAAELLAPQ